MTCMCLSMRISSQVTKMGTVGKAGVNKQIKATDLHIIAYFVRIARATFMTVTNVECGPRYGLLYNNLQFTIVTSKHQPA